MILGWSGLRGGGKRREVEDNGNLYDRVKGDENDSCDLGVPSFGLDRTGQILAKLTGWGSLVKFMPTFFVEV